MKVFLSSEELWRILTWYVTRVVDFASAAQRAIDEERERGERC